MTGRERIQKVLAGQTVDQLPTLPIVHTGLATMFGVPLGRFLTQADVMAEVMVRGCSEFGLDGVQLSVGVTGEAEALGAAVEQPAASRQPHMEGCMAGNTDDGPRDTIGRPVRVTSISFAGKTLQEIAPLVDREGARGADVIALPEAWTGQDGHEPETLEGETIRAMAALARRHSTYVVCPIDRQDGPRRVNTAVLIDRQGQVAGLYDKVYPYWSEFDLCPPVDPGLKAPVFDTDFGRLGMAICFDANFPAVWKRLADQGCELVIWPSAYSAGTTLQAHALVNHFYIVSSTGTADCIVYDITGREMLYEKAADINISRITLDLDRGIYHENYNLDKRDRLLREHTQDVCQELWLEREQWFVLRAKRPGVSARALARQYGLEELRDYIDRSRREIDKMRGSPLSAQVR